MISRNRFRKNREIPRKRSRQRLEAEERGKGGELASAKPGRGMVTTHKSHTGALDSAVEEHQLGEALRLHEFCWLKSMAAETIQKSLCNGSSVTQQPVTRERRRNVERESRK